MAQKGNVLFLILVAVALFAALSYAVTQSSSGGGNDISDEKAKLIAAEIVQHANLIKQTAMRLRLIKQCSDTELDFFYEPNHATNFSNSDAPSDGRCDVFSPLGGGLSLMAKDPAWTDPNYEGTASGLFWYFQNIDGSTDHKVVNVGTSDGDIVLQGNFFKENICNAINDLLENSFDFSTEEGGQIIGDENTDYVGSQMGCRYTGDAGSGANYQFYAVIIAR